MKRRKAKKVYSEGQLVTVQGTSCVFMSLGLIGNNELNSFNGFDISTGCVVKRCDGKVRLATKKERKRYWLAMKFFLADKIKNNRL